MSVRTFALLALLSPFAVLSAQKSSPAASHGRDMSVGLRFGTLGIGPEVSKLVTSHLGLRLGANFFSMNRSFDQEDITFDAKLKLNSISGVVDLYPGARKAFHFSGGFVTNPATVTGTGVPTGSTFDINDKSYPTSQVGVLSSTAKWSSVLPYVGLGFGTPATSKKAVRLVLDLGVAVGKATATISSTMAATNPALQSDLNAQLKKVQDNLDKVPVYPVISLGLVFKF